MTEQVHVPLVIYVDGVRHVVGEATVDGDEITASVDGDTEEGQRLIDAISSQFSCFSFSWDSPSAREHNVFEEKQVPPNLSNKLKLHGKQIEELQPKYNLSEIPFPPNQDQRLIDIDSFRDRPIKEPNWWEGLKMDSKEENT